MRFFLVLLAVCCVALAAEPSDSSIEKGEPPWDELLTLYRDFGLPLPPEEAPLVQIRMNGWQQAASGKRVPILMLGFLLKPSDGKNGPKVLVGPIRIVREISRSEGAPALAKPDAVIVEELYFDSHSGATFPLDPTLTMAIQCHARGYAKLARALYKKGLEVREWGGPSAVSSGSGWMKPRAPTAYTGRSGDDARTILAGTAWTYWMNELVRPGSDWKTAHAMMKKILAAAPALADESRKALLVSLEAALMPSTAKPGSVEADIDALVDCAQHASAMGSESERDAHYQKLLLRGFEAAPALIEHLDDQRLSRSIIAGFNNFPTMPRRVGEIAADLLQGIAGADLSRDWLKRQLGAGIDKSEALRWWSKAKVAGEETYLSAHVIPDDKSASWVNAAQLSIIEARYPRELPKIYETLLDRRTKIETWPVAVAISRSALPRQEKLSLFIRGAVDRSLARQKPAIRELRKLDSVAADAALLKVLRKLPAKAGPEVWNSEEAGVSQLVMESASPAVWDAFSTNAKRAHVSLRMEWMDPMDFTYIGDQQRGQRLRFLAQFLDDETLRDTNDDKKLYDGPCAAYTFPRITVRDFAAMQIASILNFKEEPDEDWLPEKWAHFRGRVAEAIATELK